MTKAQHEIKGPTLLLRTEIAQRNLKRMSEKVQANGLDFRPHFKTHQSQAVGKWFRGSGVDKITVSSIKMAEYFADGGWQDITIAIPLNLREIPRLNALARRIRLHTILDQPETARQLILSADSPLQVWIEIDTGDQRSGIPATDEARILQTAQQIHNSVHLHFAGLIAHGGHSYEKATPQNAQAFYNAQVAQLHRLQTMLSTQGIPTPGISFGDTPLFSMATQLTSITEARPGNFIFYDLVQHSIGSCSLDDIAVAMACPVISVSPERSELIVHGGGVHFSKDYMEEDGRKVYGKAARPTERGWELIGGVYLKGLSQEHGVVAVEDPAKVSEWKCGDLIYFLPVHSCLTADCMGGYLLMENGVPGKYVEMMPKQGF